ncbi:MAG: hypothetical protein ACLQU4_03055 [Limisphaerales bacterium]
MRGKPIDKGKAPLDDHFIPLSIVLLLWDAGFELRINLQDVLLNPCTD